MGKRKKTKKKKSKSGFSVLSLTMKRRCVDMLTDDCLEIVFKQLRENRRDIASLSSVCKAFLSITNRIKTDLTIKDLSTHQFDRLLRRFPRLKSITIEKKTIEELAGLIGQILQSGVELKALSIAFEATTTTNALRGWDMNMKSLKKLTVTGPCCDDDLISLMDMFSCLETLVIDFPFYGCSSVTDDGMEVVSSKLKGLVKISLICCRAITDQSLMSLSFNCPNLSDIVIYRCDGFTENGIGFIMQHSSMLTSIWVDFGGKSLSDGDDPFTIKNSVSYARNLEDIKIRNTIISDELLLSIAKSCPLLRKISILPLFPTERCFTNHGLKMLMEAHTSLEYFETRVHWLTDESIVEIFEHFNSLTYVDLKGNTKLSSAIFLMLTKRCPFLKTIIMDRTSVGSYEDPDLGSHQNFAVNSLGIRSCNLMNDSALKLFGSVCPNLEILLAKKCPLLTDDGISEFVRICPKMRLLEVSNMNFSKFLGANNENGKLNLKTICASETRIGDVCMKSIGLRCPDLEELDIADCQGVTSYGIEEVVRNCKKIKKIDMDLCQCVSIELLEWMVKSSLSLEHIIIPFTLVLSEKQNNFFLHNGCMLQKRFFLF